jgi:pyruvate/2-oxoglutarate dehydrogenase complex dihydrolipoamide acyltransferase (E2) component
MNIDFKLPELGENIHSGDVVNVLVKEGDVIAANDGVVELETDKAVVEIPCPHAGRIAKLLVKKGDTVKVGQALATIASGDSAAPAAAATSASAAPAEAVKSASAGASPKSSASAAATAAVLDRSGPIPAGPAVRRQARELGIDLRTVAGSGRNGRITVEDLQTSSPNAAAAAQAAPASAPAGKAATGAGVVSPPASAPVSAALQPAAPPAESGKDAWGPVRVEKISRIRRTIAEQMTRSASTIPHVTNFDDADVTELERLRQGVPAGQLGQPGQKGKLTMMPFVMKAVAVTLRRHASLNAVLDEANEQIIYKEYVNLGVAVDTPRGLVVPNVRGADRLSILQLAQALSSIAERARGSQFAVDDLRGGTFTISNLGAVGGSYSTPIINYPEVAILLLGRARWQPVVRGPASSENPGHDRIESRLMMPLSLSFDHRLVDGATAGRFLNEVIRNLESPGMLLLA